MEKSIRSWTLSELAKVLGGELAGAPDQIILRAAPAGSGDEQSLTFASDPRHLRLAEESAVGAILVASDVTSTKPHIRVASPARAFGEFLGLCARPLPLEQGIHPTAIVHPGAQIAPTASIGAYAVVEQNAFIEANCRVYPFCYVGDGCHLSEDVILFPHVVLYQDIRIGARTIVHAGTIIGADGFGYKWDGSIHRKVPQVGGVVIGSDCEIGALTAIDRATSGQTVVGTDTKIDNLVQVGHNTRLGDHVILASGVGISGSCEVGDRVTMAGMVGLGDHIHIANDVVIAARSATTSSLEQPGVYKGFPARPVQEELRIIAHMGRLPEMAKRIHDLEQRLAEWESKVS
jgi:UDP-3-O-[3-hydroxymyristoyl] glucosamine N-acyltransferase